MTKKRYFKKEWEEEYYIFDSKEISEEKVDKESEYTYDVFAKSMQGNEVVNMLNIQNEKIEELEERNKRQYNRLSEIGDLILDRNWKELDRRATELEENERLLQEEWRFYEI